MGPRLIKALTRLQSPIFTMMRGRLQGPPTLRLWTMGRTSGQERAVLLLYLDDGPRVIVVASYGGYSEHPQWWKNLLAEPNCRVWSAARGAEEMKASELEGEEREAIWERLISMYSPYAGYQEKTSRRIPLVALTPSESD
ncbi:MAG: nitroreductase family deazaflavin-dependent oxidoreductase [Chloroflexi bacterium]|nr:nitroreductase family deazaflavin-dependent oxidoreductase [Chloroflexota bacterium]MYF23000.1 nitroreductase family deazaflavin-dependent oxidoreductase [Chloroflexota bacterium]